jgi:hypothetical protein
MLLTTAGLIDRELYGRGASSAASDRISKEDSNERVTPPKKDPVPQHLALQKYILRTSFDGAFEDTVDPSNAQVELLLEKGGRSSPSADFHAGIPNGAWYLLLSRKANTRACISNILHLKKQGSQ